MLGHDPLQRGDPVHHRHLDVEDHEIDGAALKFTQGDLTVRGGADDVNPRIGIQKLGNKPADDGGIVNHHDAYGLAGARWLRLRQIPCQIGPLNYNLLQCSCGGLTKFGPKLVKNDSRVGMSLSP